MGSFSMMHWMVVLLIVLLLFGAGKLPRVMGDFAKGIKAFKAGMKDAERTRRSRRRRRRSRRRRPDHRARRARHAESGADPARPSAAMIRYSRLVGALPAVVPFVPPEALERGLGRPVKLRIGANESAFGPSPKAVAAIHAGAQRINWYCDPEGYVLREALARHHGVKRENIALGAGADDILGLVVRAVLDPGDAVAMSQGGYPTFAFHVSGFGGKFVTPPYRDFRNDAEALGDAARKSEARLVYLANPDNPTGSWLGAAEQLAILDKLPAGAVLVLDEAYSDFAPAHSLPVIDPEDSRVLRVRTFSKAHGMAGARVGYAIALPRDGRRLRQDPTPFRRVAPVAGGGAGLARRPGIHRRRSPVSSRKASAITPSWPSDWACARCPRRRISSPSTWARASGRARRWRDCWRKKACSCACPAVAPLDRLIRVTVGTKPERQGFAEALTRILRS